MQDLEALAVRHLCHNRKLNLGAGSDQRCLREIAGLLLDGEDVTYLTHGAHAFSVGFGGETPKLGVVAVTPIRVLFVSVPAVRARRVIDVGYGSVISVEVEGRPPMLKLRSASNARPVLITSKAGLIDEVARFIRGRVEAVGR